MGTVHLWGTARGGDTAPTVRLSYGMVPEARSRALALYDLPSASERIARRCCRDRALRRCEPLSERCRRHARMKGRVRDRHAVQFSSDSVRSPVETIPWHSRVVSDRGFWSTYPIGSRPHRETDWSSEA